MKVWRWKTRKSNWRGLPETTLRATINGLGARERRAPLGPYRSRLRTRRLSAVSVFRERFGEDTLVERLSKRTLPFHRTLWLPGGYAWFLVRSGARV